MNNVRDQVARLMAEDADLTVSEAEQLTVLLDAFLIFRERNARYHDVWQQSGWRGSLYDLRKKVTRLWATFWQGKPSDAQRADVDDALDTINYAVFFIRNMRQNNEYGSWG